MTSNDSSGSRTVENAAAGKGRALKNFAFLSVLLVGCIIAGFLSFKGKITESTVVVGTVSIVVYGIANRVAQWAGVAVCLTVLAYNAAVETQYVWVGIGYFFAAILFLGYNAFKEKLNKRERDNRMAGRKGGSSAEGFRASEGRAVIGKTMKGWLLCR